MLLLNEAKKRQKAVSVSQLAGYRSSRILAQHLGAH